MSLLCNKEKLDPEEDDDLLYEKLRKQGSFLDDLLVAVYEVRLVAPFVVLACLVMAYHLFIAPYNTVIERMNPADINLAKLRPVLTKEQQLSIRETVFWSETSVWLPADKDNGKDIISFMFQPSVNRHGSYYLPEFFYQGVLFGLTSKNSHNLEYTAQNRRSLDEMKHDVLGMRPGPTQILKRVSLNNQTSWEEHGMLAYFSYEDLSSQGMLSSDALRPFKRIETIVLELARKYKQAYITVYYPHVFGHGQVQQVVAADGLPEIVSRYSNQRAQHRYTSIIREVIPTRTGLDGIKSTSVMWLSKVNHEEPHLSDEGYLASIVYQRDVSPL